MLKIVVFDGGCGGQAVANYLAEELGVIEVICAADCRSELYERKTQPELNRLVEKQLQSYIGKADLIVLGGYIVALALDYLCARHPYQKFVSVGVNYHRILHTSPYPMRITAIMNMTLLTSPFCEDLKDHLPFSTLAIPDCTGWSDLAGKGQLSTSIMQMDLAPYFDLHPIKKVKLPKALQHRSILETVAREKYYSELAQSTEPPKLQPQEGRKLITSDVVLILNTCLWNLKQEIEDIFGYKVRVLDFRKKLLHDVCTSLGLLGLDGERSK